MTSMRRSCVRAAIGLQIYDIAAWGPSWLCKDVGLLPSPVQTGDAEVLSPTADFPRLRQGTSPESMRQNLAPGSSRRHLVTPPRAFKSAPAQCLPTCSAEPARRILCAD